MDVVAFTVVDHWWLLVVLKGKCNLQRILFSDYTTLLFDVVLDILLFFKDSNLRQGGVDNTKQNRISIWMYPQIELIPIRQAMYKRILKLIRDIFSYIRQVWKYIRTIYRQFDLFHCLGISKIHLC